MPAAKIDDISKDIQRTGDGSCPETVKPVKSPLLHPTFVDKPTFGNGIGNGIVVGKYEFEGNDFDKVSANCSQCAFSCSFVGATSGRAPSCA